MATKAMLEAENKGLIDRIERLERLLIDQSKSTSELEKALNKSAAENSRLSRLAEQQERMLTKACDAIAQHLDHLSSLQNFERAKP